MTSLATCHSLHSLGIINPGLCVLLVLFSSAFGIPAAQFDGVTTYICIKIEIIILGVNSSHLLNIACSVTSTSNI